MLSASLLWSPILALWLTFSLCYVIARYKDDYSVIDICWGLGFVILTLTLTTTHQKLGHELGHAHFAMVTLVCLWALRLSGYIFYRNRKKGEDARYTAWRKDWGDKAAINFYFRVYLLQAVLNLLVGSGLWMTFAKETLPWSTASWVGLIVSAFGLIYETVADWQKDRFKSKSENSGKPCRKGLWYFSRHPNYFGEMVFWWGLYFFSWGTDVVYYAWIGPLAICFFLAKVSGVPLLTEEYKKKPLYKEYLETTNTFIPWFPKENS